MRPTSNKDSILATEVGVFLSAPAAAWGVVRPVLAPVLDPLARLGLELAGDLSELLTQRLRVPFLTSMIEATILGGRELNLLRVVSLIGALCLSLARATAEAAEDIVSFGAGDDGKKVAPREPLWHHGLILGISVVNSLVIFLRSIQEASAKTPMGWTGLGLSFFFSAMLGAVQGGVNMSLAVKLGGSARKYAIAASTMDILGACWLAVVGKKITDAAALNSEAEFRAWMDRDTIAGVLFGATTVGLAIGAYCEKEANDEQLSTTLAFRSTNWLLRALQKIFDGLDNKYPWAHPWSLGFAGLVVLVDLGEGAYVIYALERG